MDRLKRPAIGGNIERSAQHFLAAYDCRAGTLERRNIQLPFQPHRNRDVESGTRRIELIKRPQAFLRVGERRTGRANLPSGNQQLEFFSNAPDRFTHFESLSTDYADFSM